MQHLDQLSDRAGAISQILELAILEVQLHDLLDARGAELYRDADEQVVDTVLALQIDGAGQDTLLVEQDGIDHLDHGGGWSVEGAAALQELYDLRPAVAGAIHDGLDPVLRQQLGDRHPGDGRHARQRNHRVAVTAEHQREDVADGDPQLLSDKCPVAGGVQYAGHPDDPLAREAARLHRDVAHRVQGVGDDDDDRLRGVLGYLPGDAEGYVLGGR